MIEINTQPLRRPGWELIRLGGTPITVPYAVVGSYGHGGAQPTSFSPLDHPNHATSLLQFVEQGIRNQTKLALSQHIGRLKAYAYGSSFHAFSGLPTYDSVTSTGVSLGSLFGTIFRHNRTVEFPLQMFGYTSQPVDLLVQYIAGTMIDLEHERRWITPVEVVTPLSTGVASQPSASEPRSRVVARHLADFLGLTLEQLGDVTGIGRTTFTSWQTKNPRPATVRDLYRLDALIRALRSKLGDDAARTWLHIGQEAPITLLREKNISAVENLASPILFSVLEPSRSLAVSPYSNEDLSGTESARDVRVRKRVSRGRLEFDN